jgi:5-methylcytosine-specific restriction endonuclease McrA
LDNREKLKKRHREWKAKNGDKIKAEWQAYYQVKGRARLKAYRLTAKGHAVVLAVHQKRRAGYKDTDITSSWLAELLAAAENCPLCGIIMKPYRSYPDGKHIDHIKPLASGGKHVMSNVWIICAKCNLTKSKYELPNKKAA